MLGSRRPRLLRVSSSVWSKMSDENATKIVFSEGYCLWKIVAMAAITLDLPFPGGISQN